MPMRKVFFLRKKIAGENSIEELASTLLEGIPELELRVFPCDSSGIWGMVQNIFFACKYSGDINHLFSPGECYVLPFMRGKKIVTWHDVKTIQMSPSKIKRFLRKLSVVIPMRWADKLVVISSNTKTELEVFAPSVKHRIVMIYNAYNKKIHYHPKEFNKAYPMVLHIGTAARKNLDRVMRALYDIPCKLWVVGKMTQKQKQLAQALSLDYCNEFDLPYDRILDLYNKADIISFPSMYEGFGMPVIEANAVGRALLTSHAGALKEIVGDSAYVVNPENCEDIEQGFYRLINDESLRESFIVKGLDNAKRFSASVMINKYKDLYESVVRAR